MEIKYYQKLFDCISTIESSTERERTEQTHPSLSPKSIFNSQTSIRDSFSDEVIKIKDKLFVQTRDEELLLDQAREIGSRPFEVRLGRNYGRIYGFIWNNTFGITRSILSGLIRLIISTL